MNLRKVIREDSTLLSQQQEWKKYRDDTWITSARPIAESVFREAVGYMKESNHLLNAWVTNDQPSESEELVILRLGSHKLPIEHEGKEGILETGAGLSVAKQADGRVIVMLYPYSSEVRYHRQKEFMLTKPLEPMQLNEKELQRCIKRLLFLANITSTKAGAGSLSPNKVFRMKLLVLQDVRNREDLLRSSRRFIAGEALRVIISLSLGFAGGLLSSMLLK